jgi:peptide chain release factor subunit 1
MSDLLDRLTAMNAPERTFLSLYLASPRSVPGLDKRLARARRVLAGPDERDEREHFDQNVKLIRAHLDRHPFTSGSLALFCCWALDVLEAVPLPRPTPDLLRIDSSPFIRPLAEFLDEYENVAVVVADNKKARIFMVTSAVAGDEEVIKGNVKGHVRKGGWSQQRYERRRDKQLLLYAREIVDALGRLDREESFRRIVLVGGKEILRIVHENLPAALRQRADTRALDLRRGPAAINQDIYELLAEQERRSERDLWERIRSEYLRGGLGTVGIGKVLAAAREGRIETMMVNRAFRPEGRRCRDCDHLEAGAIEACPSCGSSSVFAVGLVNELVEMLEQSGATTDFADPIPSLVEAGEIAALLRY